MSYLSPNIVEEINKKVAKKRFVNSGEFFPGNKRVEQNLDFDLDWKENNNILKRFLKKFEMDAGDQNENSNENHKTAESKRNKLEEDLDKEYEDGENNLEGNLNEKSVENEILDIKLYPNRKQELVLKDGEDIEEMSKELLENYKNNLFDRRLLKKKGRWVQMKKMMSNKENSDLNVKFEKSNDDEFEKSQYGKVGNFKKSNTFLGNKNISKIVKSLKDHMDFKRRLPQCVIIGMRKAGTKALITFLELNKNIKTASKEVHFFDTDENYIKGFEWYKDQMPYSRAGQITIEKTPRYVLEDKVPDRIYRMNSSIKLILIVKEPVLRAISEYAQNYARSKKNRQMTFEEYALKRGTGEVNVEYKAVNRSIYYLHMPKWLSKFHRKQIHIVDGDELVEKPETELNKIENFLGLEQEINSNMFYFNKTKGFKCARRDEFSEPICLGANKGREHPVVLSGVIKKLQDFYRPLNKKVPINLSSESDVATINKLQKSNFINSKIDKNNPTHTNENEDNRVRNDEENRIPGIHTDASARSPTAKQRLPGAIIIGMSKAGTRALNDYLTLNPNIKGTKREVHFFERDKNYSKGYEWYKGQLAYSEEGQLTIERTPRYVVSDNVPERIYRMNSSIKILVIVKEPLTRAISEYVHNCAESAKYRRKTFEQYSIISETGEVNTNYKPISKSVYFKYMPKWYRYFPQDQIFVVDGDNMITNPLQEINKVERFLGFTPQISEKNIYFNTTKGFYCMRARHIDSPKCLAKNKGRPHPVIRPDVVKKLHQYFRPLNEKFFLQIGKRFDWP
ncbi:hypothetical protein KUTeg_020404 [Tegillarca granosa]|uniref:Sulfotransferase domain-containing protein n=1 Tax=Tegillarca granosa TaxID=220873 RepID=A0ABQ9E7Y2_TEGGR|nr:hypothetical protein KUTeg_020404 [Tegillarca granosa]